MTYEERKAAFLADVSRLSRLHRVVIGGCGCCDSPWLENLPEGASGEYQPDYQPDPAPAVGFFWKTLISHDRPG